MAGQSQWSAPDTSTNAYVVRAQLEKELYWDSTWRTIFGRMNQGRKVMQSEIAFQGGKITFDKGNASPVWEKDFNEGTGECRYTLREISKGMATYGDASVKTGDFAQYYHSVAHVIQHDSPAYPIVGAESAHNIYEVIPDLIKEEKDGITLWSSQEMDLDAFRAIFMGASRGLLLTTDGGKGITLFGGSAGGARSPYNVYVETVDSTSLVTPSATLATHNTNVYNALSALSNNADYGFDYESHLKNSHIIDTLRFAPVKFGSREYRAVALTDRRNLYRILQAGGTLSNLMKDALERGADNPVLNHMQALELDNILYVACEQVDWFRPSLSGGTITWGCANSDDPREEGYANTSNITATVYLGAGALLRGRRTGMNWTGGKDGGSPHSKTQSYCIHWNDGWTRNDYFTKDSRTQMKNRSMLVAFNYDPGVGASFAA